MAGKPKARQASRPGQVTKTWAAQPEDLKLIEGLKAKFEPKMGLVTDAILVRMGLRVLAEQEGVSTQ
jgi:hypothetical protein